MSYAGYGTDYARFERGGVYDSREAYSGNGNAYEGYGTSSASGWAGGGRDDYYFSGGSGGGGGSNIPFISGPSNITAGSESYFNQFYAPAESRPKNPKDLPVHSRLFVVHGKGTVESDLRSAFGRFGELQDINMLKKKDHETRHLISTGASFVKFAKASEAAKAIEDLHGKPIPGSPKPLKILVAVNEHRSEEVSEEERLRLFIKVPPGISDTDVKDHFSMFGTVEYFNIPKDKCTAKARGFGYVKYFRFYDAALAVEECDAHYKAIFAEARPPLPKGPPPPPPSSVPPQPAMMGGGPEFVPGPPPVTSPLMPLPDQYSNPVIKSDSTNTLKILCDKSVDERQLSLLCDLIPGFKRCDMISAGSFQATFTTVGWSQYAFEKLSGLEYPPTSRLLVKFMGDPPSRNAASAEPFAMGANFPSALQPPTPSAQQGEDPPFYPCEIPLPSIKPIVNRLNTETGYAARLFIVCHPRALATHVLTNAFCRFGDLIDVYTLPGKNYGYAKFASAESADVCKKTLNQANIAGCNIKVVDAEEDRDAGSGGAAKRRRT